MCDATPAVYNLKEANQCNLLVMEEMKQLWINKDLKKMHELMQYPNWQAFYDIDYGGLPGGVFTAACPPEALHSLENGLVLHCLRELFETVMSEKTKIQLDSLVQQWVSYPKQHHMKSYMDTFPRLLYKDGLTNITEISAGTKMGILFAFVVAAQTNDGYKILHKQKETSENYVNMINAFEMLLCYWSWLKKEEYWDCQDMDALEIANEAIRVTVKMLKVLFPCTKGCEWNIPKMHEQLHVAANILLYGAHRNIHTGPQEHNHIENVKHPSKRSQKQKAVFDLQISEWLVDRLIIDYTHVNILLHQNQMNQNKSQSTSRDDKDSTQYAAKFAVYITLNQKTKNIDLDYHWISASQKNTGQDDSLLKWIVKLFFKPLPVEQQLKGIHLRCHTEYTRQGITFRCHPNYKNEGSWYDYVLVAWENPSNAKDSKSKTKSQLDTYEEVLEVPVVTHEQETTSNVLLIPAKILCFVQDSNDNYFAVIHSCHDFCAKMSVLTYRWQLEYEGDQVVRQKFHPHEHVVDTSELNPIYWAVSVDTLQKHCLMIPYDSKGQSKFLMQVIDQHKWANNFATV